MKDGRVDEQSDDEELESKKKAFTRKRPTICHSFMQATKKKNDYVK